MPSKLDTRLDNTAHICACLDEQRVVVEDCVVYIYREFGCFFLFSTGSAARANQKKHKQAERQDRSHEPQAHFKVQISVKPDLLQNWENVVKKTILSRYGLSYLAKENRKIAK